MSFYGFSDRKWLVTMHNHCLHQSGMSVVCNAGKMAMTPRLQSAFSAFACSLLPTSEDYYLGHDMSLLLLRDLAHEIERIHGSHGYISEFLTCVMLP